MLINKTQLPCPGIKKVSLPFANIKEAKENILKIAVQCDKPYMWYNVLDKPENEFFVIAIGTGYEVPALILEEYIGTALIINSMFEQHYFITDNDRLNSCGIYLENNASNEPK